MPKIIKISDEVYAHLRALSDRSGIPMARLVSDWTFKAESHKREATKTEEKVEPIGTEECEECGELVPKDSSFCPYCGVEFEEEEEEEED